MYQDILRRPKLSAHHMTRLDNASNFSTNCHLYSLEFFGRLMPLFAVFDGHGGDRASDLCSKRRESQDICTLPYILYKNC